ncbi:hypothetical protein K461DRAFT_297524 [Myriangium duriaei CBS 260.36]|uniref:Uncharacterized protein n=1 Tax=Myriangium duriaei CBS 260.36 TaxID=1168546 RepID=A0A9P4ISV8_9PEZI|nr:hypothetical protein K461DRAFT_297524 [Myriangium duriaei CBS 260.36]
MSQDWVGNITMDEYYGALIHAQHWQVYFAPWRYTTNTEWTIEDPLNRDECLAHGPCRDLINAGPNTFAASAVMHLEHCHDPDWHLKEPELVLHCRSGRQARVAGEAGPVTETEPFPQPKSAQVSKDAKLSKKKRQVDRSCSGRHWLTVF